MKAQHYVSFALANKIGSDIPSAHHAMQMFYMV